MEVITIILSSLLTIFASGGFILNRIANKQINSYLDSAEELAIRVDNTPNYKVVQGKIDRFRLAARGIRLQPDLRIDSLELETDPLDLNLADLNTNTIEQFRSSLRKPLQGAFSLVIKEKDLAEALGSEVIIANLQKSLNEAIASRVSGGSVSYQIINPQIELSAPNNLSFTVRLNRQGQVSPEADTLDGLDPNKQNKPDPSNLSPSKSPDLLLNLNMTIETIAGKQLRLANLQGTINSRPLSSRLLKGFAEGISDRLDLTNIENLGIFSRFLQLKVTEDKLELIGFVRMETKPAQANSNSLE